MNIADMVLVIVWGFFLIRGYFRGLIREVASIIALGLGFYLANNYLDVVKPYVIKYMAPGSQFVGAAAYLVIFVGAMIAVWFVVLGFTALIKLTFVQWANNLLGGMFGVVKGVVITSIVYMIVTYLQPNPEFLNGSRFVYVPKEVSKQLSRYIPDDLQQKIKSAAPVLNQVQQNNTAKKK